MADNKFTIIMQGPEGEEDLLPFNHFIDLLQTFKEGLGHLDHLMTKSKDASLQYRITNLKHSSPFTVEVIVEAKKDKKDISGEVVTTFISGIDLLEQEKEVPDIYDIQMLETIKKIGSKRKKLFSDIRVINSKSKAIISEGLERKVNNLIGDDRVMYGSMEGKLERIGVHNDENKFDMFPVVGPIKVECKFPPNLYEKAYAGMKHLVSVKGKLKYKGKGRFPYKIIVEDITIYPPEDKLPTLSDLRGIAPNMTGDMSTLDFIRSIREDDE